MHFTLRAESDNTEMAAKRQVFGFLLTPIRRGSSLVRFNELETGIPCWRELKAKVNNRAQSAKRRTEMGRSRWKSSSI